MSNKYTFSQFIKGDFVYITDNAYSQAQIRTMEMDIMEVLRFDLGRPLPLHFLRRNSKAGQVDATIHTLAKYAMELTLVEYNWAHVPPSKTAAAALAISLVVNICLSSKYNTCLFNKKKTIKRSRTLNTDGSQFVASNFELFITSYWKEMKTKLSKIYGQKPYRTIQITH